MMTEYDEPLVDLNIQMQDRDYDQNDAPFIPDKWTDINFNMVLEGKDIIQNHLRNPDQIIIHEQNIKFMIDYPLEREFLFNYTSFNPEGWTAREILTKIIEIYNGIYKEEDRSMDIKLETLEQRMARGGLINRGKSNGTYGIWGHDIGDLFIEGVSYDKSTKTVYPTMGS